MLVESSKVVRSGLSGSASFDYRNLTLGMTRHAASAFVAVGGLGWACIRYKLNAGYIVLFLLSFVIVASSWMAYFTLRRLKFSLGPSQNVFAGEAVSYQIQIAAPNRGGVRRNIDVFVGQSHARVTLGAGKTRDLVLSHIAAGRGRGQAPVFLIQTVQPFGLWRIKGDWLPSTSHWVYPRPEKNAPKLRNEHGVTGDEQSNQPRPGNDSVGGLRAYAPGDSPKRISWRTLARTDGRIVASKQIESQENKVLWLTEGDAIAGTGETETMLSRLTAWVLEAHAHGWDFGLELRHRTILPAHSEAHLHQCLQALASYGIEEGV